MYFLPTEALPECTGEMLKSRVQINPNAAYWWGRGESLDVA